LSHKRDNPHNPGTPSTLTGASLETSQEDSGGMEERGEAKLGSRKTFESGAGSATREGDARSPHPGGPFADRQ